MREPESLEDSALDRELQALLTVDPSPDFLARVRIAVSGQRPAHRFSTSWLVGSFAAAAAAIIVGISISTPNESLNVTDMPRARTGSARDIQLPGPMHRVADHSPRTTAREPQPGLSRQPHVEVLVWREDAEGFHSLVNDVAERRFEVVADAPILPPSDLATNIAMRPIIFEPFEMSPIDKGAFQ